MKLPLTRLLLYVQDPALLKAFYQSYFGLRLIEEIEAEWVVLDAGGVELALHRVGVPFRASPAPKNTSNAKLVFTVPSGLGKLREQMANAGVSMREPKRYDGFPYLMCDGEDPEGNVFQLLQPD
jgi:catechol 2,3-dioxygenase-like lactoylglutathione lyase family enzyme